MYIVQSICLKCISFARRYTNPFRDRRSERNYKKICGIFCSTHTTRSIFLVSTKLKMLVKFVRSELQIRVYINFDETQSLAQYSEQKTNEL